ncbi:MAG: hypothetical protein JJ992_10110, partial [Planctomycetes bacterium]|nr:hypothetical protein [Planctomycetota bacterium]
MRLRAKLLIIMLAVSSLTFGTAVFGIVMIDGLAGTANTVLDEYVPLSRCAEQSLLAVTEASVSLNKVQQIQNPEEFDQLRVQEGGFRRSIVRFDMFIRAMLWGSNSRAFRQGHGGLTLVEWQRTGWQEVMVVSQAPFSVRQSAGEADIFFGGFARYGQEVLAGQRRILRLRLMGREDEARREQAVLSQRMSKAENYADLVTRTLEELVQQIHVELAESRRDVAHTHALTRRFL